MDKLCTFMSCRKRAENHQDDCKQSSSNNKEDNFKSTSPASLSIENEVKVSTSISKTRLDTLAQIGEDWLYLALLGIIMALLSFSMDSIITLFLNTRLWLFRDLSEDNLLIMYLGWCVTPIFLVTFSSAFVHLCSPTAIGSGIPEMKTILRGVVLNEYLTFRTLIAKVVGLTFTLGSGLPLGKEGPSVHMAAIVATLLSKLVASFQGIYENESRTSEMLSAACAVGVAATFYAPIGGVLFSIEVTTVYFAVRNYWRGFFAACCGATIWRLLSFWIKNDESISALFKTNFRTDYPFDPVELLMFSFIGVSCGLAGAAYIKFHRMIVQFFRRHKRISGFLQKNYTKSHLSRFVYPVLVTLIITTVTFPPMIGKYTASTLSTHTTFEHLFSNRTWSMGNQDLTSKTILDEWTTPDTDFHLHLVLYIAMLFWTSALASTIPIPSGLFIPVLKMGAAYGRLIGELMHAAFPNGIKYGRYVHPASIVPGSYAVVGAAAFSGAVTHTISTSVILFEMTGQIVHIIPVILGVLIANAVCQSLQPSIYDSIIEIKKLPYLPPIASSNSLSHRILVKDFMNTSLAYVSKEGCTYGYLKNLLAIHKKIISFPLVESSESMKLLGSVPRPDLLKILYLHLGRERRLQEVVRRDSLTTSPQIYLPSTISGRLVEDDKKSLRRASINKEKERISNPKIGSNNSNWTNNSTSTLSSTCEPLASEAKRLTPKGDENVCLVSTRLVIEASPPANYGATRVDSLSEVTEPKLSLIRSHSDSSDDNMGNEVSIAKLIDHYNRGSSMEAEQLDKSIQKIQDEIASSNDSPEVVVVIPVPSELLNNDNSTNPIENSSPRDGNLLDSISSPQTNRNIVKTQSAPLKQVSSLSQVSQANRPTKSILKTSSTSANFSSMYKRNVSSQSFASSLDHYESKQINSDQSIQRKPNTLLRPDGRKANFIINSENQDLLDLAAARQRRKVRLPRLRVVDMTPEEQEQWEREQLNAFIDISGCQVDEAPFQLVEQTSLYRVHTLFSMLGLNHAYVTSFGRLVGIVALRDIRYAIEKMLQDK